MVWEEFQQKRKEYGLAREIVTADAGPLAVNLFEQGTGSMRGAIGTPDQIAELLERYEQVGIDQAIFISQAGKNRHEDICESLELFGKKVLPCFAERREAREEEKRQRLEEACERALARRSPPRKPDPDYTITPQGEPTPALVIAAARRASASGADGRPSFSDRMRQAGQALLAAFVRGRSDEQLERTIGSGPGLRMMFKGMERAFVPEKSRRFSGDIQYELNGSNGTREWVIRIDNGRAIARPGHVQEPTVTLRMPVPVFARIAAGELHAGKAMFEGQLEVTGDFEVAGRLAEMFGQQSLI